MLNSIRLKIALIFIGIFGLLLIVYVSFLYGTIRYLVYYETDNALKQKMYYFMWYMDEYHKIHERFEKKQASSLSQFLQDIFAPRSSLHASYFGPSVEFNKAANRFNFNEDYVVLYSPDGTIEGSLDEVNDTLLNSLHEYIADATEEPEEGSIDVLVRNQSMDGRRYRIIMQPYYWKGQLKYVIQIATHIEGTLRLIQRDFLIIFASIPVVLFVIYFLGKFIVSKTLQPIDQITRAASTITHDNLDKRLSFQFTDEEILRLVNAFNKMIDRLQTSFAYIEEFSSNVAHELKTPIAIIQGEAEVALRTASSPDELKGALMVCIDEARRTNRIIDDLLFLTNVDYADRIAFERFSVRIFFKKLFQEMKRFASEKEITMELKLPEQDAFIFASELHLRRMFVNLVDNAIKFTSEGGMIILSVTFKKNDNEKMICVEVIDTGSGISEKNLEKIWNRFFSLSHEKKRSSGLGLSIVRSIVALHSGTISVKSIEGKGTTFTVVIPFSAPIPQKILAASS